ncbi:Epididymal-specific lipocalin-6 [Galemys pyrenaicus]|uniref:Epididymal-specific lipocalin-6 n=1 Tax=Galemys pyrenaicus TaxID=202257 RepID=A0A8J6AZG7_GALPY|nr:Epididymal-specific lipocalin-6 [Galemys pyrenaicus]
MRAVLLAAVLALASGPGAQGLWLGRLDPSQVTAPGVAQAGHLTPGPALQAGHLTPGPALRAPSPGSPDGHGHRGPGTLGGGCRTGSPAAPIQLLGSWYVLAVASGEKGFALEKAARSIEGVVLTLTPENRLQVRSSRHRLERCELSVVELLKQKPGWVFANPSLGVAQFRVLGTNFRDFAVVLMQLDSQDGAFSTVELYSEGGGGGGRRGRVGCDLTPDGASCPLRPPLGAAHGRPSCTEGGQWAAGVPLVPASGQPWGPAGAQAGLGCPVPGRTELASPEAARVFAKWSRDLGFLAQQQTQLQPDCECGPGWAGATPGSCRAWAGRRGSAPSVPAASHRTSLPVSCARRVLQVSRVLGRGPAAGDACRRAPRGPSPSLVSSEGGSRRVSTRVRWRLAEHCSPSAARAGPWACRSQGLSLQTQIKRLYRPTASAVCAPGLRGQTGLGAPGLGCGVCGMGGVGGGGQGPGRGSDPEDWMQGAPGVQ